MGWVLSDPSISKVAFHSSNKLSNSILAHTWSDSSRFWRHKQVKWKSCPNAYSFYSCYNAGWCQECTCKLMRCDPWWLRKRRLGPISLMTLSVLQSPHKNGQLQCNSCFWDNRERHQRREVFTVGRVKSVHRVIHSLGSRKEKLCNCLLIHEAFLMTGRLGNQGSTLKQKDRPRK